MPGERSVMGWVLWPTKRCPRLVGVDCSDRYLSAASALSVTVAASATGTAVALVAVRSAAVSVSVRTATILPVTGVLRCVVLPITGVRWWTATGSLRNHGTEFLKLAVMER